MAKKRATKFLTSTWDDDNLNFIEIFIEIMPKVKFKWGSRMGQYIINIYCALDIVHKHTHAHKHMHICMCVCAYCSLWRNRGRTPRVFTTAFCLRREKTARAFSPGICLCFRLSLYSASVAICNGVYWLYSRECNRYIYLLYIFVTPNLTFSIFSI